MIVSEARIEANRRNARRSTGPVTADGKKHSRANALKHGLCSSIVVPEDLELIQQRSAELFQTLKPQNEYQIWIVEQAALLTIRIERCERIERRARDKVSLRAELTWDDDRRLEAEILGGFLARKPAETVETLRRSPHGCEWLMTRWAMLAHAADVHQKWTEDQTRLAFDLLATPPQFRDGPPGASLDFEGRVIALASDPAAVARREIAALKERREVVADLDEVERYLTEADLTDGTDPEVRRTRRYESTLHTRLRWCLAQLKFESPHKYNYAGLKPKWTEWTEPPAKPEPKTEDEVAAENPPAGSVSPPFDLEPDEYPRPG